MKRIVHILLPLIFVSIALVPTQARAEGTVGVETAASPADAGTTWQDGDGRYGTGDQVSLHAEAAEGFVFDHWDVDSVGVFDSPDCTFALDGLSDCTIVATAVFAPAEHVHAFEQIDGKAPTCVEEGAIFPFHYYCPLCDKHYGMDGTTELSVSEWQLPATGSHTWDEGEVTKEPAVGVEGERTYTCTVCGATEIEAIPALEAVYEVLVAPNPSSAGTVTGGGTFVEASSCTLTAAPAHGFAFVEWRDANDGATVSTSSTYTFSVWGDVSLLAVFEHAHTWENVPYKQPTCTESGNAAYSVCTGCGMIVQSTSTMLEYEAIPVIPATGHAWGPWEVSSAATCTSSGTQTRTCNGCGKTESVSTAALGHSWSSWTPTKSPTCTENGVDEHVCTRCGATETRRGAKALGHSWDEGTVAVEPTEKSVGVRTYTCTRCGATKNEPIEKVRRAGASDAAGSDGADGGGTSGRTTGAAAPSSGPSPASADGIPVPLIICGVLGLLALIGLIVLFILRKSEEDEEGRPAHYA